MTATPHAPRQAQRPRRYRPHPTAESVDVEALAATLRERVRGEVRFDAGSRAAYSTDSSNYRMPPLGVVVPLDVDDVVAAVGACAEHGAPVTHRGAGTSLSGETTNVAVVIDTSKYCTGIGQVDAERRSVWSEPGVVNDRLREAAGRHQLTFGPDPSTHDRCTIGGNLGNNSCGVHSLMSGRTSDNTLALDVLLYDGARFTVGSRYSEEEIRQVVDAGGRQGEVFAGLVAIRDRYADLIRERYPRIPRRVSGYNLDDLLPERGFNVASALVGTEGTCVTILGAQLRLVPWPRHRVLLVLGYPDITDAADHVGDLLAARPIGLEATDSVLVEHMRRVGFRTRELPSLPEGSSFLLVEFGADTAEEALATAREVADRQRPELGDDHVAVVDDPRQARALWSMREAGLAATARIPGEPPAWPGWEDSAVPPERMGDYIRDLRRLYRDHGYTGAMYGHFGEGCLHTRVPFDFSSAAGVRDYRRFMEEASDLVLSYGGSLSGEHGDGQQRGELLTKMFGPELVQAMREFKAVWDPTGRMNPGKVVDPVHEFGMADNLRLGPGYRPATPATYFAFPDDNGSFEQATLRCVGVGKCRALGGQTMCPSFQTLREEEHSTRGRARLLFEMLEGEVVTDGWRSREVFDALDLCLSCKGCKSDCPTGVDMATYKAEFLAHHYEGRLRPRHAYAMGLVMYAARAGSRAPRLANVALHAPLLNRLVKRAGGVHPDRPAPRFARQSFRAWFAARPRVNAGAPRVLLFPDTFSNHFHADVAQAVCEVLESAGFEVVLPERQLCCGRPLFDYGMLRLARRMFRDVLDALADDIVAGTPMVVPEPSCCASFRDELLNMFPHDRQAQRLAKQTFTLAEFLQRHAPDLELPRLDRRVLVQDHCHHASVMGTGAERALLDRMGVEVSAASTGCCGLAGSWGYERDKYDISMRCGERELFPAVRDADPDTVVVADGFSCRSQIEHGTGRRAVHLAQLVRRAQTGGR